MRTVCLIIGILSIIGAFVAFIPLLGWMNWGVIPFAVVGLIISIAVTATSRQDRGASIAGIVLCTLAIFIGAIRLILGGGIL